MIIRSSLGILLLGLFLQGHVEAQYHDKTLLKTNALGYSRHNKNVAYSANYKVNSEVEGSCVNGPPPDPKLAPNVQTTKGDTTCQALGACHIGFTTGGDWVAYDFEFDEEDLNNYKENNGMLPIEVAIRASANSNRKVDLKLFTEYDYLVTEKSVVVPGTGFQNFNDVVWKDINLDPKDKRLRLYIFFVQGKTNLCSIDVRISGQGGGDDDDDHGINRSIPFAINALEYDGAVEVDNKISGNCITGQPPIDEPDAQTTKDSTCRKLGPCHISFTEKQESVTYNFKTSGWGETLYADFTVRVSSNRPKNLMMSLFSGSSTSAGEVEYFRTQGNGYDSFYDVTWRRVPIDTSYNAHRVVVTFSDGNVNMCSIDVEWNGKAPTPAPYRIPTRKPTPYPHHPTPYPTRYPTPAPYHKGPTDVTPITWSAFEYGSAYDTNPESYQGNCHNMDRDDGVDGSYTNDKVCNDRDGSECYIGWTRPDEWLRYNFFAETDGRHDIRVRVAANSNGRKIKLNLSPDQKVPFGKDLIVPDNGWNGFSDVVWKNVYLDRGHYELQVKFVTGFVNLCSTAVYLSNSSPTPRPSPMPTRKPTRSPHDNSCYDDEDFRYDGDFWKDCSWVEKNSRCNKYQNGWHIGREKCRKSCGECQTRHPTNKPTWKPPSKPTRKPTKRPTKRPTKKPTRKPTPHPTYDPNCYDVVGYRYNGDHWKDCKWVADNNRCNRYENGIHIGKNKCRRTCGYCHHPTNPPTRKPSRHPTRYPTRYPTKYPTTSPVDDPTPEPTPGPTRNPTRYPTRYPTKYPTKYPTTSPVDDPTPEPTPGPTRNPTRSPTRNPTRSPTVSPTKGPTKAPTGDPTSTSTPEPTNPSSEATSTDPTVSTSEPSSQPTPTNDGPTSEAPTSLFFFFEPSQFPSLTPSDATISGNTADPPSDPPSDPLFIFEDTRCGFSSLPSIGEIICDPTNEDRFGRLCTALDSVNTETLKDLLNNDGNFTVFGPTSGAFDDLPSMSPEDLSNILSYHVAPDQALGSMDLECDAKLRMFNNGNTTTECRNTNNDVRQLFQVGAGNAVGNLPEMIDMDIIACNGILHVISDIILPGASTQ